MMRYFCRVELRGDPSSTAYQQLHSAMVYAGFTTTASDNTGSVYSLPHAMYSIVTSSSLEAVNNAAKSAAGSVQGNYLVLTILASDWSGWLIKS